MKICAVSDIHGNLDFKIPECDVLCICGDIVELNVQRNPKESDKWWTVNFVNWVDTLPCRKVILTPGNHDMYIEHLYNNLDKTLTLDEFKDKLSTLTNNKVKLLIDESYEFEGIKFYGTPWIAPIHWQTWAFEDIQHQYDEYICPYEKIEKCDILLTHENPNYNDKLEHNCFGKYKHHFFGHWHNGISYGHLNQHNCSILTDSYQVRKNLKIVTVDIESTEEIKQAA